MSITITYTYLLLHTYLLLVLLAVYLTTYARIAVKLGTLRLSRPDIFANAIALAH